MYKRFFCVSLGILCLVMTGPAAARTWYIKPDGTGDAPTIQAGIDSASAGDTVLVSCGTFYEHDISMKSGVCLRSVTGLADCVTIDAQQLGRVIHCQNMDATARIEGFTITNGHTSGSWPDDRGGGIECDYASPAIEACDFVGNWAVRGGGIRLRHSSSSLRDCNFIGNSSTESGGGVLFRYATGNMWNCSVISNYAGPTGGGIKCFESSPLISDCTIVNNYADLGGGLAGQGPNSNPVLVNTIVAFNTDGGGVYCDGSTTTLSCSDVFGNGDGDWTGCFANQYGVNGNFSADPLFCDPDLGDFSLRSDSPCLPGNHPDGVDCGLIGTFGEGCSEPTSVQYTSWGGVKAMFR